MLILKKESLIGSGTLRACYHHPDNSHLLIKIPIGSKKGRDLANLEELRGYRSLAHSTAAHSCIAHCHNLTETNLGEGLICDCIQDHDGSVSKTIWELVHPEPVIDTTCLGQIVEGFCRYLMANEIYVFDINLKNIALQQLEDSTYKPYIIDLKGAHLYKELLPLARYIPYLRKRKLQRRCNQLLKRIETYGNQR